MTDKELADRVYKILDTNCWDWDEHFSSWIELHGENAYAEIFVLDWRVAGALMEKVLAVDTTGFMTLAKVFANAVQKVLDNKSSFPRTIIEGSVKELS